ncbi:MAG: transaldolase [Actinomycetota bacterium]|jgi:transaldolase|nr:transaldolase [Rubrobacter sp.]MDQ3509853.1 transaldolase [Actinomycetota bacterium]
MNERLRELQAAGQSVWIDSLSRDDIQNGDLQSMVEEGVTGVTSNPSIFQKSISSSSLYDEQLSEVAESEDDPKEVFFRLAKQDIRDACEILRPVYDRTGGLDGYVSLEVSPDLAYDTGGTINEADRLHEMVGKDNLLVKIPATEAGLPAIEEMISRGKPINVTLIFSLDRYRAVAEAYVSGLEKLVASGGDPSKVSSVASFFVSRVDSEADKRLDEAGKPDMKGRLAVANAKLAYEAFRGIFSGGRWEALAAKGANPQRPLWASTSVKDPSYSDLKYVEPLVGDKTVNTMPLETLDATKDHAEVHPGAIEENIGEARAVFEELEAAGIDYDDITVVLEKEGVEKFADSFDELIGGIKEKSGKVAKS